MIRVCKKFILTNCDCQDAWKICAGMTLEVGAQEGLFI